MQVHASTVRCERFRWRDKKSGRRKAYRAEGWLVDWRDAEGKRHRKKFEDEKAAKLYASQKQVEVLNGARAYRNVSTRLTEAQLAEAAITRLGSRYSLTQCVDFFFSHFQEADFQMSLTDASRQFREAMAAQVRPRTLVQLESTPGEFGRFLGLSSPTPELPLHEVTPQDVEAFLKGLRARDGANPASPKTWNNYRGDLHRFFGWCADRPRRWITSNPAADAPRFRLDGGGTHRRSERRPRARIDGVRGGP